MTRKKHFFISYRSTEIEFALRLAADLKNAGIKLWMDRLDIKPGDDWRQAIQMAIDESAATLAILSPDYVQSNYCRRELARTDRLHNPILPILITPLSGEAWPLEAEREQYVDFTQRHDPATYQQQLKVLISHIQTRFQEQIENQPDPETRYLMRFIAQIETSLWQKAANETIELTRDTRANQQEMVENLFKKTITAFLGKHAHFSKIDDPAPYALIANLVKNFRRLAIIGEGGTGKTVLLEYMALQAAYARRHKVIEGIPLLIPLHDWHNNISFKDFLRQTWTASTDLHYETVQKNLLVYVDSLESHPDKIESFQRMLAHSDDISHLVIACRADTYQRLIPSHFPMITIEGMEAPEIAAFVKHHLPETAAEALLQVLFQTEFDLHTLAHNRLFLDMIITIWQQADLQKPQPAQIVEDLITRLWKREYERHEWMSIAFADLENALARLALAMLKNGDSPYPKAKVSEIIDHDLILQICQEMSLLRSDDNDGISFTAPIFQTYFIANYDRLTGAEIAALGKNDNEREKWADRLVKLTEQPDKMLVKISIENPVLALKCLSNDLAIQEETLEQIFQHWLTHLTAKKFNRQDIDPHLLERIAPLSFCRVILALMRESPWEIRCAAHSILRLSSALPLIDLTQTLDQLDEGLHDVAAEVFQGLGDMVMPSLIHLLSDKNPLVRCRAAWALGELRDAAGAPVLVEALHDSDQGVVIEAAFSLGVIADPATYPFLVDLLARSSQAIQQTAFQILAWIGEPALPALQKGLKKRRLNTRLAVVQLLSYIHSPEADEALLQASYDHHAEVRASALEGFRDRKSEPMLKRLKECLLDKVKLRNKKQQVSDVAADVLNAVETQDTASLVDAAPSANSAKKRLKRVTGSLEETPLAEESHKPASDLGIPRSETILYKLIETLRTANWGEREQAAIAIREYAKMHRNGSAQEILSELTSVLDDSDWMIRWAAAEALAWIGSNQVVPPLITRLQDENHTVKAAVIRALSEIGDTRAVEGIAGCLADPQYMVCEAAIEALGKLGDNRAIAPLTAAYDRQQQDAFLRFAIIEALSHISDKKIIPLAMKALDDSDKHVRWAAAYILVQQPDESATLALIDRLQDTDSPHWDTRRVCDLAATALRKMNSPVAKEAVTQWQQP